MHGHTLFSEWNSSCIAYRNKTEWIEDVDNNWTFDEGNQSRRTSVAISENRIPDGILVYDTSGLLRQCTPCDDRW